jgi:hypothetical protein
MLFQVGLPAGTYEEVCYFLPLILVYMYEHPGESFNCHSEVVWFLSEYAQPLAQDNLLAPALDTIKAVLARWMGHFTIQHYTTHACRTKGWGNQYYNIVENSQSVCQVLEDIIRFVTHATWAETFTTTLAATKGNRLASAWFLELCYEYAFGLFRPANAVIMSVLTDRATVQEHGSYLIRTSLRWNTSRTYWRDVFQKLGVEG